jgi:uncharacterized membrane protein YedE/YeeE
MPPELAIALLAGSVLGVSAHRAGLCTVKAVAEIMTSRRGVILSSFIKASLWTTAFVAVLSLAHLDPALGHRPLGVLAPLGGLVFGLGARLNGACSFSTLTRLAEGHFVMLFTLLGWVIGSMAVAKASPDLHAPALSGHLSLWLVLPGIAWIIWESRFILKQFRTSGLGVFGGGYWPLSLSVLLIAAANTALLAIGRPWSFTSSAICLSGAAPIAPCHAPGTLALVSVVAMVAMIGSAMARGSFRPRAIVWPAAVRHLMAGSVMGLGAALIPGGNDGLILFGMPSLSAHALPSWLGIACGIAITLSTMRLFGHRIPTIRCDADICRAQM